MASFGWIMGRSRRQASLPAVAALCLVVGPPAVRTAAADALPKDLDGLASLSHPVAAALSKHKGTLVLQGVTSIDKTAATALTAHDGVVVLTGIESVLADALNDLRKAPEVMLPAALHVAAAPQNPPPKAGPPPKKPQPPKKKK